MRVKHFVTSMLVLFLGFALTGCAGLSTKSTADITCTTKDINAKLKSGDYQKKVDNFLIIQDASSSMSDKLGKSFTHEPSKLALSKDLVRCLNSTLPDDFDVNAGMRVFGPIYADTHYLNPPTPPFASNLGLGKSTDRMLRIQLEIHLERKLTLQRNRWILGRNPFSECFCVWFILQPDTSLS